MVEEEYEIMSHSRLNELKQEVDQLKKGPSAEMHESMNQLKGSMDQMINLFKVAAEEMRTERIEEEGVDKKLGPLMKKLDKIAEQQDELANGMVAIADMIKEHFPKIEHELEGIQKISTEFPKKKPKPMFVPPPVHKPIPPYPSHEPRPLPPLGPSMPRPGSPPSQPSFEDEPFPPFSDEKGYGPSFGMPQPPRGMPPPPPRGMPPPPPGMGFGPMPSLEPLGPPPEERKKKGILGGLFKR